MKSCDCCRRRHHHQHLNDATSWSISTPKRTTRRVCHSPYMKSHTLGSQRQIPLMHTHNPFHLYLWLWGTHSWFFFSIYSLYSISPYVNMWFVWIYIANLVGKCATNRSSIRGALLLAICNFWCRVVVVRNFRSTLS